MTVPKLYNLKLQVNLIITLSLGSIETDQLFYMKPYYNEVGFNSKEISLGAMTWLCYIDHIIVRHVVMKLD